LQGIGAYIYNYKLALKWGLSDMVVGSSLYEQQGSFFGQSKAFSYDRSVLAGGAFHEKLGKQ